MPLTPRQKDELDRHITGNYGEDRYRGHAACTMCGASINLDLDDCCEGCGLEIPDRPAADPDQGYDRRRDEEMVSGP